MKILLEDFNVKVGREDILKPTTGNENMHEISNFNGVKLYHIKKSSCQEHNVPAQQHS
jgi:hypothetical protein